MVGVGLGWVLLPRLQRATRPAPSAAARAKLDAAHRVLERDDPASLEQAVALTDEARMLAPGIGEPVALRALASAIMAASLRDEADDLVDELKWLEGRLTFVRANRPDDATGIAALEQRVGDARARLPIVEERGGRAAAEARRLVAEAAEDRAIEPVVFARAEAAILLLSGDVMQVDGVVTSLTDVEQTDPWLAFARGAVRGRSTAEARVLLDAAVEARPTLLRARTALGRLALAGTPPDLVAATDAFETVLRANPTHDAARRGLSRIADLAHDGPAAAPSAAVQP